MNRLNAASGLSTPLAAPRQADRLLRLYTSLGADALVAETATGLESIDAGYRVDLTALSGNADVDLQALVGQPALLELRTDEGDYRPLHGRIVAIERVASNGGLARYRLVLEPGLALLRHARDTYVFRDRTWLDITEEILGWYPGLAPEFKLDLHDASAYARYDQWTLYDESPLDALLRLWADEGVFHYYAHEGDPSSASLGRHTLILADHNEAFGPQTPLAYAYHRRDATEARDTIQQLHERRRLRTNKVQRGSWDYRSLDMRAVSAQADGPIALEDRDVSGPYAYHTRAEGERRAQQHLDAHQLDAHVLRGTGALRRLTAGQRFAVTGHYNVSAAQAWICHMTRFQARNNFEAGMGEEVEQLLGKANLAAPVLPTALAGLSSLPAGAVATVDEKNGYFENHFHAIPAHARYRPRTDDGHGRLLYPRAQLRGLIPAIVIGDGGPIHTDRDHRIQVQLVSRRGGNGSPGMPHPSGADNAPGRAGASMWVRVGTPWAGDNWGTVWVPRVGQLVNLAALEGQADRLVCVGAAYDGRGNEHAPHNQVGGGPAGATGNAPAWFEGNDHPAVLSGIKTQELQSSQDGSGGFNQWVFDDSPGQGRVQVSTTQADTALTLGHLKQQDDNRRKADRGFGIEVRTQASAALRAGSGLLLTTEPGAQQLSADGAQAQLERSQQLLVSLAQTAQAQQAQLPADQAPEQQPAVQALAQVREAMAATQTGNVPGHGISGGEGQAPAWSAPLQVVSSPAGIVALTPASVVAVSGTQTVHAADQDINWAAQDALSMVVAEGVQLFTHGHAAEGDRPVGQTGIALHAASGPVQVRALKAQATLAAEKDVRIASINKDVHIAAPSSRVLLTAGGAYIKIEGGSIEIGAPGKVEIKSSRKVFTGPASASTQVSLPSATGQGCAETAEAAAGAGALVG